MYQCFSCRQYAFWGQPHYCDLNPTWVVPVANDRAADELVKIRELLEKLVNKA